MNKITSEITLDTLDHYLFENGHIHFSLKSVRNFYITYKTAEEKTQLLLDLLDREVILMNTPQHSYDSHDHIKIYVKDKTTLKTLSTLIKNQLSYPVFELHNELSVKECDNVLQNFLASYENQSYVPHILLSTEEMCCSYGIPFVSFVINYDFTKNEKEYLYRNGNLFVRSEPKSISTFAISFISNLEDITSFPTIPFEDFETYTNKQ